MGDFKQLFLGLAGIQCADAKEFEDTFKRVTRTREACLCVCVVDIIALLSCAKHCIVTPRPQCLRKQLKGVQAGQEGQRHLTLSAWLR